jgi:UDP-glucuronate decarboxylase
MKRILITGGAGFIGSHLADYLLAQGHYVISVDHYGTGQHSNIAHLSTHPRFEAITHDIIHPFTIQSDQIYHLACPASPIHYQLNPINTIKTAVLGSINVLGLAKKTGATVLLASTSEVYGDPTQHPQSEDYFGNVNPIGPRSCYDEGKRCAESLFTNYHLQHHLSIRIARIFNTYGPRMHPNDGRVVSNFICQALTNTPITLFGNGAQTRSFCYVDDMVTGLVALMNHPSHTTPINLGNPEEITIQTLSNLIIQKTKSTSPITHHPLPQDDPIKRQPDITLATTLLNWAPSTRLSNGLEHTIAYFTRKLCQ